MKRISAAAAALLAGAACAPRMQPIRPVIENGAAVPTQTDAVVARAAGEGQAVQAQLADQQAATTAAALGSCAPQVCRAIARGELAVGMTEPQLMAATGTTGQAWDRRGGDAVAILAPRFPQQPLKDHVAEIAYVTLQGGRVASYTYREPQGLRVVASAADATYEARSAARAEALLAEGDDFAARGDFVRALDRFDRADVIHPNDPRTTLAIARALDKQLRPIEASLRYQLFLHQMELETIRAQGDAYAKLYGAIAEAHERVVVLDHRR
jgi:tetratricopeptide (TPR) repeat protein